MQPKLQPYFKGIEKKLIDNIQKAKQSINIAMAWFTNNDIKESLVKKREANPAVEIRILVDENEINRKYFLNSKTKFENSGIFIDKKISNRFLHHKFMVIDNSITIIGSYNFSKKANANLENIAVIDDEVFSLIYNRVYRFLTTENYIDKNIKLLFDNPSFAQSILSTYYQFSQAEYRKYKEKIKLGECFTHENGMYDEIKYYPGLIFNPKIKYKRPEEFDRLEFPLPIDKELIKSWVENRNMNLILDFYRGKEDQYHLIDDDLEQNKKGVEEYFSRKIEKTYQYEELKRIIEDGVDIIIEDDLWLNNFELFINKAIVEQLFDKIEKIEEENWW